MGIKSTGLIVLAIIFLVVPGMLYNNLNNNGLVVSQSQALTCSSDTQTPTCQIGGNVGCQSSSSYCTLSGASISFLNENSVFTKIFTNPLGTVLAPISQTNLVQQGPFDFLGGGPFIKVNCWVGQNGGSGLRKWSLAAASSKCIEVGTDNSNKTASSSTNCGANNCVTKWVQYNGGHRSGAANKLGFWNIPNATYAFNAQWIAQINFTGPAGSSGWTYYGMDFHTGATGCCTDSMITTEDIWGSIVAIPNDVGAISSGQHEIVYVQLEPFTGYDCVASAQSATTLQLFRNPTCAKFWQNLQLGSSGTCTGASNSLACSNSGAGNSVAVGFLAPLVFFLLGVVLLIIGLGIGFNFGGSVFGTGTTFGMTANEQGSRMAQTLGLALVIWVPLYSQFSTWFSSGFLPYGFDGTFGIMSILISAMFFFGIYWRALSQSDN